MSSLDLRFPSTVTVRDVTLRDGLQDEQPIGTDEKLAIYGALIAAGVTNLELTSFVRPDRVPAMADAEALTAATNGAEAEGIIRWGLVLNARGAERALAAGLTHLQFVLSVSEAHNQANSGGDRARSLVELRRIAALAAGSSGNPVDVEATLATSFGCPYAGPVDPVEVVEVAKAVLGAGAVAVSLADTIGTAVPTEVVSLVRAVQLVAGTSPVAVHLHDTRGLGVTNALAAIGTGADRVDGTVGGLGGCPFAPGATGNLALEDLVHALHAMGVATGTDLVALTDAAAVACAAVGRPVASHIGLAGPRFARLA